MGLKPRPNRQRHALEDDTAFINIDLDLVGPVDHAPLVAALGPVHAIHTTNEAPFFYIIELDGAAQDFDATMSGLLDSVENLDEAGRSRWNQCSVRRFNIGLRSRVEPRRHIYSMSVATLRRLAELGAEVVVTLYSPRD